MLPLCWSLSFLCLKLSIIIIIMMNLRGQVIIRVCVILIQVMRVYVYWRGWYTVTMYCPV